MIKWIPIVLILCVGCIPLSHKVTTPISPNDPILRASIVKDLSFVIRENPTITNSELKNKEFIYRGVNFDNTEKLILIEKARRVNDDWDGN